MHRDRERNREGENERERERLRDIKREKGRELFYSFLFLIAKEFMDGYQNLLR